ncbi:aminoglycoside phosphotransferase family protein [Streptomyces sp. KR80]|uniref:aminoglycoside phosphotransferase family protein n=1 Tax=Streptomyces sp. KR80 TaxID=3457426 RepID=UPI003FD33D61
MRVIVWVNGAFGSGTLVAAQFPQWAGLPVEPVDSAGTSNAMHRLGEDMVVRLPRIAGAANDVEREHTWLPRLAPPLPVAIPVPLGKGAPAEGYPWHWSVYRWLDGENPIVGRIAEPGLLAEDLAEFVAALHRIDPADGPPSYRSEPLATRDAATRAAVAELRGIVDTDAATAAWDAALQAPAWPGPAVWIHADLQPGNLLMVHGRLSAVIDFGCLGVGDPAVDLIVAWYVLPTEAQGTFRAALGVDDATWARGRGWALSIALLELQYYRDTNPVMAAVARRVIHEVLADHEHAG